MKSRRKIWSVSIALAVVLVFAGLMGASQYVAAQSVPSVPASKSVVAPVAGGVVAVVQVSNYSPVASGTVGPGPLPDGTPNLTAVVVKEVNAAGDAVTPVTGGFAAAFAVAAAVDDQDTPASKINRITVTAPPGLDAGSTYTVKVTARYDSNMAVAANDDPLTLLVNEAGVDPLVISDDRNASVTTTITVHVPTVAASTTFQIDPAKVVDGELISRVGRDRDNNPMTIDIVNLGPGIATVVAGTGETDGDVEYVLVGGNKIQVKAATNNLGIATYNATINIPRGDVALNDLPDADTEAVDVISLEIDAEVVLAQPLAFTSGNVDTLVLGDAAGIDPGDDGIYYSTTVPETVTPGTGILPYFVHGPYLWWAAATLASPRSYLL